MIEASQVRLKTNANDPYTWMSELLPLSAKAERQGWKLSNSEILGPEVLELPPTLDDIGHERPKGFRLKTSDDTLDDPMMPIRSLMPPAWSNGRSLLGLKRLDQLDARLPPPSPQNHGVYLVAAPRRQGKYMFTH